MPRSPLTLLVIALLGIAACSSTASEASDDAGSRLPPPTIGLGSEVGGISGGADVRAIDTGSVDSIVMIGDSITVGAQPILQEQLEGLGFDDVTIVAQELKRVSQDIRDNPSGVDIANFIAADSTGSGSDQLWIVALGTNDISQYDSVDAIAEAMESVVDAVPDGAPMVWVNTYFADRPQDTADVNAAIDQIVRERGNAVVGEWNRVAPGDGVLRSDGVHPNSEGAKVFAAFVTSTVADFLQR